MEENESFHHELLDLNRDLVQINQKLMDININSNVDQQLHPILRKGSSLIFKLLSKRAKAVNQMNKFKSFIETMNFEDFKAGAYKKEPFLINPK